MITIAGAYIVEGVYQEKPYKSGRLIALHYNDQNAKNPAYVQVLKCKADLVQSLRGKCPIVNATVYYDQYKNIVSVN